MAQISMTVTTKTMAKGASTAESAMQKEERFRKFWGDINNAKIYFIGQLLANEAEPGRTAAKLIAEGGKYEIGPTDLVVNGRVCPLPEGFYISLDNVQAAWGCPSCHSAHGSGVRPSKVASISEKNLLKNKFYYNPKTQELFTISDTCFGNYVQALGGNENITTVPAKRNAA